MLSYMKKQKEKRVQVMIRMSDYLRTQLKIQAKAEHKSFNAYVVGILEEAVEPEWPRVNPEDIPDSIPGWPEPFHSDVVLDDNYDWKAAKGAYLLKKFQSNEES